VLASLRKPASCLVLSALLLAALPLDAAVRVRMGTVVPRGSAWHEALQRIEQEWRRITGGEVRMTIYPGGVLGDEVEMVRQVRQRRIQAVGLSSVGLSHIDEGVAALQLPMMFRSYEELDYVRGKLAPKLEKRLEAEGFKVLNWGDGGWVRFFTKRPARTLDDIRKMKLFISAGDPETEALYKRYGFRVVPLSLSDLLTSLQTGMVEAFDVPPLFALLDNSYKLAPHMIDVRWAPLIGGTVVSLEVWKRIPERHRPAMLEAAHRAGEQLRSRIRELDREAIEEMKMRGLKVIELTEEERKQWQREAEAAYSELKGPYAPAGLIDEALRLRDEFRSKNP